MNLDAFDRIVGGFLRSLSKIEGEKNLKQHEKSFNFYFIFHHHVDNTNLVNLDIYLQMLS